MFGDMFGFSEMGDTYEDRKIENTEVNGAVIDTCEVTDSSQPYETGISHPLFNSGEWVIVEMYDTREEAIAGHSKWVKIFTVRVPDTLQDVSTSNIIQFAKTLGLDLNKKYTFGGLN